MFIAAGDLQATKPVIDQQGAAFIMLLDLRETVRNSKPIKYTLITIIIIPFALVGIGSYLSGGSAPPVAEVNGQPITQVALDRAYSEQRQQLARMFGGQLPEAFANEGILRQQALQQLISEQVLESEVVKQKFAVGDATLGRAIRELPVFQVDGRFDTETYQTYLRSQGMSVPQFEQSFRDSTALDQFRTGISDTSFTLPTEAERLSALTRQTRTVEAIRFDLAAAKEGITISDDDLSAYFEEHKDSYKFPQRVKINYIELNSASLAADIEITEEQAQTYYDENRSNFILPEQRSISHILLDEGDEEERIGQLNELKTRIENGESFADLAKEFSADIGTAESGGSLGIMTPGVMEPVFEDAVMSLVDEGDLSDPLVTGAGVHLIRLDTITPESGKPFEDVKEEIIVTMQQDEADREYFELRELVSEQAFDNPDSLEPASDVSGLEIQTSDWLDSEVDLGPVLSSPEVMSVVFTPELLEEGLNSDLITVGDRHVLVVRVVEHEGPRDKSLDDVRDQVTDELKSERATEMLTVLQGAVIERLRSGETAASIVKGGGYATAFEQLELNRQSTELDGPVISQIFALSQPSDEVIVDSATLSNGDLLALRLDTVQVPELADEGASANGQGAAQISAGANPQLGGTEFEVLLESLRGSADIEMLSEVSP